jgi:AraC family transcriptional regulator
VARFGIVGHRRGKIGRTKRRSYGRPQNTARLGLRQPTRGLHGTLPRGQIRAVVEYIEEHLDASPTLGQMAAVVGLSPYYFARPFKAAIGLPPHQYLLARRVARAKHLLQ